MSAVSSTLPKLPGEPAPVRPTGGWARVGFRMVAALGWTMLWLLLWGAGTLGVLPWLRLRLRWRRRASRAWAGGLCALLGIRIRVEGPPPSTPFLLATNHLSYVDILVLLTCVDGVFVAKHEMRGWPGLGMVARAGGTIWVNRGVRRDAVRVLRLIARAFGRGDGIVIFAEGTTGDGSALLPFRPALFEWAAREARPVHYAALSYSAGDPALTRWCVIWHGPVSFGRHAIDLCRLPGFDATVRFGREPVTGAGRGDLAERLRAGIDALLGRPATESRRSLAR